MKDIFKLMKRKDFREAEKFYGKFHDEVIELKVIRGKLYEWDPKTEDWSFAKLNSKYIDADFFLIPNSELKEGVTIYTIFTLEEFANGQPFTNASGRAVYKIVNDDLLYYNKEKHEWVDRGVDKGVDTFRFRQMTPEELSKFKDEFSEYDV